VAVQSRLPIVIDLAPFVVALAGWYGVALVRRLDHLDFRLWLASRQARRAERNLWHVVHNSGEAIVTMDAEGKVETLNQSAETVFGIAQNDARGRTLEDLIGNARPEGEDGPIEIARPDGRRRLIEVAVTGRRVAFVRDVTEARHRQAILRHQATHDPLTDLPNRALLAERLAGALQPGAEGEPAARRAALLIADLDGFKEINDTLGHATGDALLQAIAARLDAGRPERATLARLGGDEFALLLPGAGAPAAEQEARRLLGSLTTPFEVGGMHLRVEASVGIALHPDHASDSGTLMQRADVAMYQAKRRRGTFRLYDAGADLNSVRHLTLKGELREAIDRGELELHYQPQLHLGTGTVAGAEALVRWRHPGHGWLSPQEFIPMAERTGLIRPLTRHVIAMALRQAARWDREGRAITVSVNCSARNLLEGDFTALVSRLLEESGVPAGRLVLEITETAIIEDALGSEGTLRALAAMGVKLSIDDFGTAYAALDYLRRLPASEIKIDRSFVQGLGLDPAGTAIVRGIIRLAHDLGLHCVAEGAETGSALATLKALGCDQAQGYAIARPMPAGALEEWFAAGGLRRAVALPG
jgi:diguanylate cyclase (GGDEF)-like protein/PAS domain S-box-containing protein